MHYTTILVFARLSAHCAYRRVAPSALLNGAPSARWFYPEKNIPLAVFHSSLASIFGTAGNHTPTKPDEANAGGTIRQISERRAQEGGGGEVTQFLGYLLSVAHEPLLQKMQFGGIAPNRCALNFFVQFDRVYLCACILPQDYFCAPEGRISKSLEAISAAERADGFSSVDLGVG